MTTFAFRALTSQVAVTVEPHLAAHLSALTLSYEATGAPCDLRYHLGGQTLWRNGRRLRRTDHALDLVPAFELDLYRAVIEAGRSAGWLIHAAGLELGGRTLVLAGASGAGKSTLATLLVASGAGYLSDECLLVDEDGRVFGLRRGIAFEREPAHISVSPRFTRRTYPLRGRERVLTPALLHPPNDQLCTQPAPLGFFCALQRETRSKAELRPLSPGEALSALWEHSLERTAPALRVASSVLAAYPAFALAFDSFADARATLSDLVGAWAEDRHLPAL